MDHNEGSECPRVLVQQLQHMVEFADAKGDYVLAAWLTQAQERLRGNYLSGSAS